MTPEFTAEQLAIIREYHRPLHVWAALGPFFHFLSLGLFIRYATGPVHDAAQRLAFALSNRLTKLRTLPVARVFWGAFDRMWRGPGWGGALLFVLFFLVIMSVVELPASVYFDYIHERNFGLSRDTPWTFGRDALKGMAAATLAFSAIAFGLYGLARRTRHWWVLLGAVASVGLLFSGMADPYRGRLYFRQRPLEPGAMRAKLTALLQRAEVDAHDIVVEETAKTSARVQAYFAGQGPTRVVVLNDALLTEFSAPEVVAAVAHEAGHIHQPRWLGRFGAAAALLLFLYGVSRLLVWASTHGVLGVSDRADVRTMPLVLLAFGLVSFLFQPLAGAVSRAREHDADAFALSLTRDPETFSSMLMKATLVNKLDPDPPRWRVWLGQSHPPVSDRLARAAMWKQHAGEQTTPTPTPHPHP